MGEIAQWLKAPAAHRKNWFDSQYTLGGSHTSLKPILGDLTSTSGSHKDYTNVIHRHTIRQSTHAYNKNKQVF